MKSKRLFQIFVVFALVFSSLGGGQPAFASDSVAPQQDPIVINRNLNIWDATFIGFVSASVHEKWSLELTEPHTFELKASTVAGDLVPLLILFDSNNVELAQGTGSLVTSQPAGSYFVQVQPESGGGFYFLTLRDVATNQPSSSTVVNPTNLNVAEAATVTVNLNNVPAEGYTSAEFTCTYDASLLEVSNVVVTNLFGADPATAITAPQNGSFIVAIAGSNGNKATTSGAAFTFSVLALQAGLAPIECIARVSQGNNVLTTLPSTAATLTINGSGPTSTPTAGGPSQTPTSPAGSPTATNTPAPGDTPTFTPTAGPVESATPTLTSTPIESPTPTLTFTPVETLTSSPTPLPTFTSTPVESPTPIASATPLPNGTLNGQVLALKPVTVSLFDAGNVLVTSVAANPDGTFSLTAPVGTYTVFATASGFLSAQGSAVLNPGSTTTKPNVTLLAGDIDGNNVIDQFDALTIGINYNSAAPAAADLNNDGVINVLDLELLAQNYRDTGPIVWE
jgi:hypothetical protein